MPTDNVNDVKHPIRAILDSQGKRQHLLAARMIPFADEFDRQICQFRHRSDFIPRIMKRIAIVFRLNPSGLMNNRRQVDAMRRQKFLCKIATNSY